ncbi:DUF3853 family protein [Segatella buccae]|uniref:DUF3853 family protein n=1 Tax=Segatella buccae TaxID=28126 RepID=UPI00248EC6E3|nr:DUF3853 family protein [Segatella buccae]
MNTNINIEQLLQKPVAMMTGEELFFLLSMSAENKEKAMTPSVSRGNFYGIEGVARIFGCSVPTANRIKKSGIIDKAITQVGRKIVIDADLALALAKEAKAIHLNDK